MIIEHNFRLETAQMREMGSRLRESRTRCQPLNSTLPVAAVSTEPRNFDSLPSYPAHTGNGVSPITQSLVKNQGKGEGQ